jgi:hypothetical protein
VQPLFILFPIPFPAHIAQENDQQSKEGIEMSETRQHPFELAMIWRQQLESDPSLTKAKISVREGFSRARVTQIMDLLKLPMEIQNALQHPPPPLEIHAFPERQLRTLVQCGDPTIQVSRWREWIQKLINS